MKQYTLITLFFILIISNLKAQTATLNGTITGDNTPLIGAYIYLTDSKIGTTTDAYGAFKLTDIPSGNQVIQVTYLGYRMLEKEINFKPDQIFNEKYELQEDRLGLEAIVVSATRNTIPLRDAPVIVNRIDSKVFERTQAVSLSEGLNFSPGLRLENNCQNCGFSQLRMNGLDGPYTQILINSRPIFSALTGVYGLDMIPANMIERVEVVRGGGSALYGGNAIAGTVNVITRDPLFNSFSIGSSYSLTNGDTPDLNLTMNGAVVSDDLQKGISFYANNRNRQPWDANNDGFSEMTLLRNNTFGFDAFLNPDEYSKIKLNLFSISEFRRGGSQFELQPHQTDITEQLDHKILGGGLSYERFSKNKKHKVAVYTSVQSTDRESYYGGGGRVLSPQDTLTETDILAINAYGKSEDLSLVGGVQYAVEFNKQWALTTGSEHQFNSVLDQMPGYDRRIDQQVKVSGNYAQLQWKPIIPLSILFGGRYDNVRVDGNYTLAGEKMTDGTTFNVFVPRFTTLYNFHSAWKARFSYAQGYRTPQAFDEDLHIQTVGGAVLFTRLSSGLKTERSNSYNASLDYTFRKDKLESNFVIDAFYTRLNNPFISTDQEEWSTGVLVVTKRNGNGAVVKGINTEINLALGRDLIFQIGGTVQNAQYDVAEEIWTPENISPENQDSIISTTRLLRTPNVYGFFNTTWTPFKDFDASFSGVYTGSMKVPHVMDTESQYTILENSPTFWEFNLKLAYKIPMSKDFHADIFAGAQNIFNAYQSDFDRGADRDSNYIYGPNRPRSIFMGIKFHLE